ncbi:MAG: hypothetical protein AB8G22_20875, partial [Saprospiraceae bacterium]
MNIRFNAFSTLQLLFILSTPLFFNPTVSAQCHTFSEVTKFLNSAISANDRIGLAIAMDGNTAAIGAVGENPSSVYIAERSNGDWIETQRIMGSNGTNFGHSVAIEGNRLVIGAPFLEQAFVYEKNNGVWSLIRTLEANDKVLGNQFGISVDISGTRVVVGANGVNNFTG